MLDATADRTVEGIYFMCEKGSTDVSDETRYSEKLAFQERFFFHRFACIS